MRNSKAENVKIRPVSSWDIETILSLHKKIGAKQSRVSYMIYQNFGGPNDFSLIAELGYKAVGFVIARLTYAYIPLVEICIVNGILVDPEYQRRQIGHKLVNELFNRCHKENVDTIRALVDNKNIQLQKFVDSFGFQPSEILNYDKTFKLKNNNNEKK